MREKFKCQQFFFQSYTDITHYLCFECNKVKYVLDDDDDGDDDDGDGDDDDDDDYDDVYDNELKDKETYDS